MATIAAPGSDPAPGVATLARLRPAQRRDTPWFVFWLAHATFWGVAFAVNLLLVKVFKVADPWWFILTEMVFCFLCTAAMRGLWHQEALHERLGLSKIGVIAGGGVLSTVLITLAMFVIGGLAGLQRPTRPELIARAAITLTMLCNWCAIYFGYQLIRERNTTEIRALQAESLALRKELERLQGQISPHFLFNALNTVMACRDDPTAIETVTQSLANYLRFLLRPAATLEPLSRELDALEEYLTIQGVRFGDGLETRIDCDLAARNVEVPPVMVQPLVENAIKYGGQTAELPVRVHVAARRAGDWLEVEVANTGRWVTPGGGHSTGTGLASLEQRLRLLAGSAAKVTHREAEGWVRVLIRVPVSRSGVANQEPARA